MTSATKTVTVTAKIRLEADASQRRVLVATADNYRLACNFVSEYAFARGKHDRKFLHDKLYYKVRDKFSLGAQMAESVFRTVSAKYKSIESNGHELNKAPDFKRLQLDLVYNRDWDVKPDGTISINSLVGRLRLPYNTTGVEQYLDRKVWTFGTARVVVRKDKCFLHIPVSRQVPQPAKKDAPVIAGVDLGINFHAVAYDSNGVTTFYSGRQAKHLRAIRKESRRNLQQCRTPSARRRLRSYGSRESRWMRDVNHCIAKALVESYPEGTVFVLEDLTGIRKLEQVQRSKDGRYELSSWAFADLRDKIIYKAALRGQQVLVVNPKNTSRQCPHCGHTEEANRIKKQHRFCCKHCGYRSNDDRVGAMNLYRIGFAWVQGDEEMRLHQGMPLMQGRRSMRPQCDANASNGECGSFARNVSPQGSHKPTPFMRVGS